MLSYKKKTFHCIDFDTYNKWFEVILNNVHETQMRLLTYCEWCYDPSQINIKRI